MGPPDNCNAWGNLLCTPSGGRIRRRTFGMERETLLVRHPVDGIDFFILFIYVTYVLYIREDTLLR